MVPRGRSSGRPRRRRPTEAEQPLTASIEALAPTGEGVAKVQGRALFVPGTLPGEVVLVQPETTGRVRRARLLSLVTRSDDRVEPPCPHVERCGGCDWMHVDVEAQGRHHRDNLLAVLRNALGDAALEGVAVETHRPSDALGYRQRARLTMKGSGRRVAAGYLAPRRHELVAVDSCMVLEPALEDALRELEPLMEGSRGRGEANLALQRSTVETAARPVLEIRWQGELGDAVFGRIDEAVRDGRFAGIRLWPEGATAPSDYGDPRPCLEGPDGAPMWLAPGGFGQASAAGGLALARHVAASLHRTSEGERVVELFAGSGTLSLALAPIAGRYEAVEQVPDAAEALRENLRLRGLSAKVVAADAEARAISPATRTVVLDPPRSGAPGACQRILEARPRTVVYVSCNPVTLARDLTTMASGGYALRQLDAFELFPQTSHVEIVALLRRERSR